MNAENTTQTLAEGEAESLKAMAKNAIQREERARKTLAASLLDMTAGVTPSAMRKVMEAAAEALPYRLFLERIEVAGIDEALCTLRRDITRQLVTRSPASSTCQLTNEAARMEIGASQYFLSSTAGYVRD
ncbi:hypothetical protein [Streptomyces sp. NPDC012616]|uniref:hypothetical protein n=1 Tax=Streptomyces sp. NPDC012616 TaxID=3364840 RepID=UPI0036EA6A63